MGLPTTGIMGFGVGYPAFVNSFRPNPPIGMTTFSGQSCVLGTADNCGLLRDEWGALALAETLIGQDMGSMLAAAVLWLGASQRCVFTVGSSAPHCVAQRRILRGLLRPCDAVGCQKKRRQKNWEA